LNKHGQRRAGSASKVNETYFQGDVVLTPKGKIIIFRTEGLVIGRSTVSLRSSLSTQLPRTWSGVVLQSLILIRTGRMLVSCARKLSGHVRKIPSGCFQFYHLLRRRTRWWIILSTMQPMDVLDILRRVGSKSLPTRTGQEVQLFLGEDLLSRGWKYVKRGIYPAQEF
jgi:hypothetical protein